MKRPRVRISTLMLLVVIAALAIALVVERVKSSRLLAEAQQAEMMAREQAMRAEVLARTLAAPITPNAPPSQPMSPK
jgi:hypothetical protein